MARKKTDTPKYPPILGGFIPLGALWDEAGGAALFPSENSARWFIRSHRAELLQAQALAMHAGRMLVDPERFGIVARAVAITMAERRAA